MTPAQALGASLAAARQANDFSSLMVAVSGGSDSLALLHLAHDWAGDAGVALSAVTVDHGLRPEAADEAAMVARLCDGLSVSHKTLRWSGWDRQGNLQDAARRARYRLIGAHAQAENVGLVVVGHTQDDLAETFLMRLARGSGVDGLAAMRDAWTDRAGLRWLRPLLGVRRDALREELTARGVTWADDPSNADPRYDRVRARTALATLAPLGIDVDRLASTAHALATARDALETATADAAQACARIETGDVVFDRVRISALPAELRDRLLAHALMWVSSNPYRPRRDALHNVWGSLTSSPHATLHGCLVTATPVEIRIAREFKAVEDLTSTTDAVWDGRWRVIGPAHSARPSLTIRALGLEGLAACPDWRSVGLPRRSLLASPAIWDETDGHLEAAPVAGWGNGWTAEIAHPANHFVTSVLSH